MFGLDHDRRAGDLEFRFDQVGDLGPAVINDDAWLSLFGLGQSFYNGIAVNLAEQPLGVDPLTDDQLGQPRPADLLSDIGAVEADN